MRGGAVEVRMLGAVVAHSVVGMPKIQSVPGSMSSPQRAQLTRPAATIVANSLRVRR